MEIEELTDKNYESIILNTDSPIFIDFYSPTCGPCQILLSFLGQIQEHGLKHNVKVLKCDVSRNPKISNKYQIHSIPFTCIVDKDKSIKSPELGLKDISYYFSLIEKFDPNRKSFFQKLFKK
jgi:thioredoxin 1